MHHYPVLLIFISHSINFVKMFIESTTKVHFSVAVSMKSCIVLVLDILSYMHYDQVRIATCIISPKAGVILTSAEFLFMHYFRLFIYFF